MRYKVKTFGIAGELVGGKEIVMEIVGNSVGDLRRHLSKKYPKFDQLRSLFIAVNRQYAGDETEIKESDEIAIIPPVSGG